MRERQIPAEPNKSSNAGAAQFLSCPEVDGLLPAYVIGATDAAETAAIRAHMRLCPAHATELAKYSRLTQGLLFSADPIQPPVRIANQLRRMIDQPLTRTQPQPTGVARPQHRPWPWSTMWLAATASVILLLGGLAVYTVRQNLQLRQANRVLAVQQTEQSATQRQQQEVYELITSAGMQFIDLSTAQPASQASAEVMWNPQLNIALLYVQSFPRLSPDQIYQLWLTHQGERQSGGIFTVDASGNGVLIFPVQHPLDVIEVIGITREPTGGSSAPTADPVVRRKL